MTRDILTNGINTNRGRAALAMAKLIEHDHNRIAHFKPALEKMVQDTSTAVKSCVAQTLLAVLRHDRDLAVELFRQLCNTEDALLQTRFIERFLFYALQTHFQELSHILRRMVASQLPGVASAGARQACLAALDQLRGRRVSGTLPVRVGSSKDWRGPSNGSQCQDSCVPLILLRKR